METFQFEQELKKHGLTFSLVNFVAPLLPSVDITCISMSMNLASPPGSVAQTSYLFIYRVWDRNSSGASALQNNRLLGDFTYLCFSWEPLISGGGKDISRCPHRPGELSPRMRPVEDAPRRPCSIQEGSFERSPVSLH